MKRSLLIGLLVALSCGRLLAAPEAFVKLNLRECVNCSAHLSMLFKALAPDTINLVLPEEFSSSAALIVNKFDLGQNRYRFIFSDKKYQSLNKEFLSECYVLDGQNVLYKSALKEINTDSVKLAKAGIGQSCQFKGPGKLYADGSVINYDRAFAACNFTKNGQTVCYIADMSWLEKFYKEFYGSNHQSHYNRISELEKDYPNLKPTITAYFYDEMDEVLYLICDGSFIKSASDSNEIRIYKEYFLVQKDLKSQSEKIFRINIAPIISADYFIISQAFNIYNQQLVMGIKPNSKTTINSFCLATYNLSKDSLAFNRIENFTIPSNYINYKLYGNFLQPIFFKNLVGFIYGNVIYDLDSHKTIELPIPNQEFEELDGFVSKVFANAKAGKPVLEVFSLNDIQADKNAYHILYGSKGKTLTSLTLNKKDNKISTSKTIELPIDYPYAQYLNPQMIYYTDKQKENCIKYVQLQD